VFGLGAEKLPTQCEALELAAAQVAAGAGGVVFGTNAIQVPQPFEFQAALCDVVKKKAKVDDVILKYNLA
jgi:DhnA family fructose-bisphosphate aldolase class Ia